MSLSYNNYIIAKVDSKFGSHNTLTNLSRTRQNEIRQFMFKLTPELNSIKSQADFFANYIVATGIFENSFVTTNRNINQVVSLISSSYVYSYVKAVVSAHGRTNKDLRFMMSHNNSYCFRGHKLIHDCIVEGYMQYHSLPNNIIALQVDVSDDSIATFKTWPIWSEICASETSPIFNALFETVLGWLDKKAKDIVHIDHIGESLYDEVRNMSNLPIGNLAYSADMLSIKFIENNSFISDKVSFFYGKAIMLSLVSSPDIDADDDIYDTILVSKYDQMGICFEVESITGFNPLSNIRTSKDLSSDYSNSSGNMPKINPYGPNLYGSNNDKPKAFAQQANNSRRSKTNSNLKVTLAKAQNASEQFIVTKKNQFVKLTQQATTILRNVDAVLTDETVNTVANVLSLITGKNLSPIDFRRRVGSRIGSILNDYGIMPHDTMTRPTDEYSSFYAQQRNEDGFIRTELVGTPKLIAQR